MTNTSDSDQSIIENSERLLTFNIPTMDHYCTGTRHHIDSGLARHSLSSIFSPEATYVFMRTRPNPEAIEELSRYVGIRENMGAPWKVRPKRNGEEAYCYEGSKDGEPNGLWFSRNLDKICLEALGKLVGNSIGKNHVHYPIVDGHPGNFLSPTIHVVRGKERAQTFKALVPSLLDDKGFEVISKIEAPQNYKMANFQLLHEKRVAPLVVDERQWEVAGKDLRDAIDFLVPCRITSERHSLSDDD